MPRLHRRTMLTVLVGTALLSAHSASGADTYPYRPVTLIVPSAPGGSTDFTARLLAEGLTRELGQQFIVDNKGGASGNIGIGQAARAEPDGYNLLLTYSGYQVNNPSLFKNLEVGSGERFRADRAGHQGAPYFSRQARTFRSIRSPSLSPTAKIIRVSSTMRHPATARSSISAASSSSSRPAST